MYSTRRKDIIGLDILHKAPDIFQKETVKYILLEESDLDLTFKSKRILDGEFRIS